VTTVALALLIGAGLAAAAAISVWRSGDRAGGRSLLLILAAGVLYSVAYALELQASTLAAKEFWGGVKYIGVCALPIFWLAFTLQFTGRGERLTRRLLLLLAIEPILVLTLLAVPSTRDLIHVYPNTFEQFPLVRFGVIGWMNLAYTQIVLLVTSALFFVTLWRIPYRKQARWLVLALALPWAANAMYNFNVEPFGRVDVTAFALLLTIVVLVWGIYRFRLLDVVPVARAAILATIEDGVVVVDTYGRVVDVNPSAEWMLGRAGGDLVGRELREVLPDQAYLVERASGGRSQHEIRLTADDGVRDFELTVSPLATSPTRGMGQLLMLRDISKRKAAEERLERLAHYDPLTGLPNRKLFADRLHQAIVHAKRNRTAVALLFLDIDRFKLVNDGYGHEVGDQLLREIAHRLHGCLRAEDTVARLGGDEFTVILSDLAVGSDAAPAARRLLDSLRDPITVAGRDFHVTASMGISAWPVDGTDAGTLLRTADVAMYGAKAAGGGRFEFSSSDMSIRAERRMELEEELRRAVDRREFVILYQPMVSLRDRRVVGFESLVRWEHPTQGLLPPSEFLWLAEEIGLIATLGEWVLRESCRAASGWEFPATVAVNLSARELREQDLPVTVTRALGASGLGQARLTLEISESAVMDDPASMAATLGALKDVGVRLSLDDFGTGVTTLAHLNRLPLDTLKIDRTFVGSLDHDRGDRAIVEAMIGLAHALGLSVVAEGVERPEQVSVLRELACDDVQGFLFAQPMAADRVAAVLQSGRRGGAPPIVTVGEPTRRAAG
jgi:diguanylate cyclase (GGDEF)-like protein/PAS domain S-box-containing protein